MDAVEYSVQHTRKKCKKLLTNSEVAIIPILSRFLFLNVAYLQSAVNRFPLNKTNTMQENFSFSCGAPHTSTVQSHVRTPVE